MPPFKSFALFEADAAVRALEIWAGSAAGSFLRARPPVLWADGPLVIFLPFRNACADGFEEESSGREAAGWGQDRGLHAHHSTDGRKIPSKSSDLFSPPDVSVWDYLNAIAGGCYVL